MCPFPHLPRTDDTHIINEGDTCRFFSLDIYECWCDTISESDNDFEHVFKNLFVRFTWNGG